MPATRCRSLHCATSSGAPSGPGSPSSPDRPHRHRHPREGAQPPLVVRQVDLPHPGGAAAVLAAPSAWTWPDRIGRMKLVWFESPRPSCPGPGRRGRWPATRPTRPSPRTPLRARARTAACACRPPLRVPGQPPDLPRGSRIRAVRRAPLRAGPAEVGLPTRAEVTLCCSWPPWINFPPNSGR